MRPQTKHILAIALVIFIPVLLLGASGRIYSGSYGLEAAGLMVDESVLQFPDAESFSSVIETGEYLGAPVINSYAPMRIIRLGYPFRRAVSQGSFRTACADAGVGITPNYLREADLTPDDPKLGLQTYLNPIQAKDGWDLFQGDSSIVVAVIDTGIQSDHPDLQQNILPGINLRPGENPSDVSDPHGHGTAVAGIIAASTDNNLGVSGLCWHVRLLPIKILGGEELNTTLFEEAAAIDYADNAGARVINMSFGGPGTSSVETGAIKRAWAAGVFMAASAGNDSNYGDLQSAPSGLNYPAAFPEVAGVGALTSDLVRAGFSNYGEDQCEFAVVGQAVYTTLPGNLGDLDGIYLKGKEYGWASGTSFAAPQVTALAALLRMKEPQLTVLEVRQRIRDNAKDLGGPDNDGDGVDDYLGYGLIQFRDTLADSPIGRNDAIKAGVFASPIFPERVSIYIKPLTEIDQGSLIASALPKSGPPVNFVLGKTPSGGYIGQITWPVNFGPVEIEIRGRIDGIPFPDLVIKYKP